MPSGILTSMYRLLFTSLILSLGCQLLASAQSAETKSKPTFRAKNIDYLDADSLAYYLQEPDSSSSSPRHDYDVAVMFYASWDKNSHALAPMYGKIAHLLQAGTKDSRLILGLFDCEANTQHMKLCSQAGVTHYPTITFFSLSGHVFGSKSPTHATTFKGNWQYGDAILDWLKAMSGLSQWHRAGWGKRIRSFFFRNQSDKKPELPIGIPTSGYHAIGAAKSASIPVNGASTATSSSSPTATALAKAEKEVKEYKELALRGAQMMEAILFPLTSETSRGHSELLISHEGKNFTDMFAELAATQAWDSTEPGQVVLYSCVLEVSLDYCQRVTSEATNDFVRYFEGLSAAEQSQANMTALQKQLDKMVSDMEPYCSILEECIVSVSDSERCRPAQCPFKDKTACRYVTSCLGESMMKDYAQALGVDLSAEKKATSPSTGTAEERKTQEKSSGKKNIWGM